MIFLAKSCFSIGGHIMPVSSENESIKNAPENKAVLEDIIRSLLYTAFTEKIWPPLFDTTEKMWPPLK